MNQMRPSARVVMIGVGWAFDVVAGRSHAAPRLIQECGLEWLYRLIQNPRKLWRRHLRHNPRFLVLAFLQLCGVLKYDPPRVPSGAGSPT
jgi:N-acetylglucosaminyldiphosphoundecaprenol N-acetyl-beta-D-mannosaminyltransferase